MNLKMEVTRKQSTANFPKKQKFLNPLIRTCICAYQEVRNADFLEKFGTLCFAATSILRFVFWPYYWWYHFAENFNVYQHAKNKLLYSFLSWDIAKILHTCDFQYFRYASPQSKIWQYQFVEIYYVYLHKNRIHPSLFSWDSAKILQTCHFGYFGHVWLRLPKTMVPGWRKRWCSFSCKKSNSSFIVFLKYCYDIASLLFWILWTCLATPTKNNSINL